MFSKFFESIFTKVEKYWYILMMVCGGTLLMWAVVNWAELGFLRENKYDSGNQDGNFCILMITIGGAMVTYGYKSLRMYLEFKDDEPGRGNSQ